MNKNCILKSWLEDFELSTGIEIACLSKDKISNTEFCYNKSSLFPNEIDFILNLIRRLQDYVNSKTIQLVSLDTNKEIAIVHIYLNEILNHYFILGPFSTSTDKQNLSPYPYRPRHCIKYLIDFLLLIIKESKSYTLDFSEKFLNLNVRKTVEYVNSNYTEPITLDTISKMLNIHKCYFCNLFKRETSMTFSNFLCKFRVEKSKELLKDPSMSIIDIAIAVGFNNSSYYSMMFKKFTDLTPLEFRKLV